MRRARLATDTGWVLVLVLATSPITSGRAQESGYQIINGTRVFTQIDHASDTATFSNECGSQTLSHQALGAGAIPSDIIPCPRPGQTSTDTPSQQQENSADADEHERDGEKSFDAGMEHYRAAQWMLASVAFSFAETDFAIAGNKEKEQQARNYDSASVCASNFYSATSLDDMRSAYNKCPVTYWQQSVIKSALDAVEAQRPSLRAGAPSDTPPSADCSDISGTGDTSQTAGSCPGLQWSMATPSNHTTGNVHFHPARGPDLDIGSGQGLNRALDGQLSVRDPGHGFATEDEFNCRSLEMSYGFVVLSCEMKRQADEYNRMKASGDNAYDNYMNSTNSSTQGENNGNLTRTTAFRFMYNAQPDPGLRTWTLDSDNQWHEAYPDGHEAKVFDYVTRGVANNCSGAVASQSNEQAFQVFIPDQGCGRMVALFRRGMGAWNAMGAMQDVR